MMFYSIRPKHGQFEFLTRIAIAVPWRSGGSAATTAGSAPGRGRGLRLPRPGGPGANSPLRGSDTPPDFPRPPFGSARRPTTGRTPPTAPGPRDSNAGQGPLLIDRVQFGARRACRVG